METIICKHCGLIDDFTVTRKANNDVATCNGCGMFIKNIPYSPLAFFFGKYAGKPIADFTGAELYYLRWARNNTELWPKLSRRLQDAILIRLNGHT